MCGYNVDITDTKTGEVVRSHRTQEWSPAQQFFWSEGNFCCDCNRGDEFCRASGLDTDGLTDEEHDWAFPCGHTRYSAVAVLPNGGYVDLDVHRREYARLAQR